MNMQKNNRSNNQNIHNADDHEAQIAHHIVDLLDNHAQHLTLSELHRLSTARNLAVSKMTAMQSATAHIHHSGNALQWFGHHRLTSATLVIGLLVISLFSAQQLTMNAHLEAGDAFLLASDLPPEAYADKGFNTWLDSK